MVKEKQKEYKYVPQGVPDLPGWVFPVIYVAAVLGVFSLIAVLMW